MNLFIPEILSLYQNKPVTITIYIMDVINSQTVTTHIYTISDVFYSSFPNTLDEFIQDYPFLLLHKNKSIHFSLQKQNHKMSILSNTKRL
jgi:hypothetical protein